MSSRDEPELARQLIERLLRTAPSGAGTSWRGQDDSPAGILACEFFANNWATCRDGLLQRTGRVRVIPEPSPAPRTFRFEIDRQFKSKRGLDAPVELLPGPVRGTIHYRPDLFVDPDGPHIAVQVDPHQGFFHPNCARHFGSLICIGELPANLFPFPLDILIETRLYPILSYQDRQPSHPFDLEAAAYFARDPQALHGLEPVEPLY